MVLFMVKDVYCLCQCLVVIGKVGVNQQVKCDLYVLWEVVVQVRDRVQIEYQMFYNQEYIDDD